MRIPNADRAVIEAVKLHGYLLSRIHPIGRFKATFFCALGYSSEEWRQLETDLRNQHLPPNVTLEEQTLCLQLLGRSAFEHAYLCQARGS